MVSHLQNAPLHRLVGFGLGSQRDLVCCGQIEHLLAVCLKLGQKRSHSIQCKGRGGEQKFTGITFSLSTIRAGVGREEMCLPTKLIF